MWSGKKNFFGFFWVFEVQEPLKLILRRFLWGWSMNFGSWKVIATLTQDLTPQKSVNEFFKWHEKPLDFKLDPQKLVKSKKKEKFGPKNFFFRFFSFWSSRAVWNRFSSDFGGGRSMNFRPWKATAELNNNRTPPKVDQITFIHLFIKLCGAKGANQIEIFNIDQREKRSPVLLKLGFTIILNDYRKLGLKVKKKNRMGVKGNFSCRLLKLRF